MADGVDTSGSGFVGTLSTEKNILARAEHYRDMLRLQLKRLRDKAEQKDEEALFGERNMAILNSMISIRGFIEGTREKFVERMIDARGGYDMRAYKIDDRTHVKDTRLMVPNPDAGDPDPNNEGFDLAGLPMEISNKPKDNPTGTWNQPIENPNEGGWMTKDGEPATWIMRSRVEDLDAIDKLSETILGWHSGVIDLEDGEYVGTKGKDPSVNPMSQIKPLHTGQNILQSIQQKIKDVAGNLKKDEKPPVIYPTYNPAPSSTPNKTLHYDEKTGTWIDPFANMSPIPLLPLPGKLDINKILGNQKTNPINPIGIQTPNFIDDEEPSDPLDLKFTPSISQSTVPTVGPSVVPDELDYTGYDERVQNIRSDDILKGVRRGRDNKDGTHSTHLMLADEYDGKFYAYPSLFPTVDASRIDNYPYYSNTLGWLEIPDRNEAFTLALQKDEVFEFNTIEEAIAFSEGGSASGGTPWKDVFETPAIVSPSGQYVDPLEQDEIDAMTFDEAFDYHFDNVGGDQFIYQGDPYKLEKEDGSVPSITAPVSSQTTPPEEALVQGEDYWIIKGVKYDRTGQIIEDSFSDDTQNSEIIIKKKKEEINNLNIYNEPVEPAPPPPSTPDLIEGYYDLLADNKIPTWDGGMYSGQAYDLNEYMYYRQADNYGDYRENYYRAGTDDRDSRDYAWNEYKNENHFSIETDDDGIEYVQMTQDDLDTPNINEGINPNTHKPWVKSSGQTDEYFINHHKSQFNSMWSSPGGVQDNHSSHQKAKYRWEKIDPHGRRIGAYDPYGQ